MKVGFNRKVCYRHKKKKIAETNKQREKTFTVFWQHENDIDTKKEINFLKKYENLSTSKKHILNQSRLG